MVRRLAAIVAVDVVGFSRLMAHDEDETWAAWSDLRSLIDPVLETGGARIVKSTGDGVLVESPSVIEAVKSAIGVQQLALAWNESRPADRLLRLRIGINLGDVIVADDGDIYGDGVNVAARLEALADPGGICLSDSAYQQVRQRIEARFVDRGDQWVKNIPTPIRVWSVLLGAGETSEVSFGVSGLEHAEIVGRGGNATVYRAYQRAMDRWVAVKVIDGSDEATRRRFDRERQAMGRLSQHPGIVTIYESGYTPDGRPFLVMPFLSAGSLQDRLDRLGPFDWTEAAAIVSDVAAAVDHAHRLEIVHRDLKPANIMLDDEGRPLVSDFGIARLASQSATMTDRLTLTPAFSPPELIDGREPTPSVDIYGLAATFCALVTGSPPFITGSPDGDTLLALSMRIASEPPPDLRDRGLPEHACLAVEAAMAKSPADRPDSARSFALALTGEREPWARVVPVAKPGTPNRTRIGLWAAGAILAIVAVVSIVLFNGAGEPPTTTVAASPSTTAPATTGSSSEPIAPETNLWSVEFPAEIASFEVDVDPACSASCEAVAFLTLVDGSLEAIDLADGSKAWEQPFSSDASATIVAGTGTDPQNAAISGGNVFVVRPRSKLVYSIDAATGAEEDRILVPFDNAVGQPRIDAADGSLFIAFGLGVASLDGSNGNERWVQPTASRNQVELIAADAGLVAISDGLLLRCLDSVDGHQRSEYVTPDRPIWIAAQDLELASGTGRSFEQRVMILTSELDLILIDGVTGDERWPMPLPVTQRPGSDPDDVAFVAGVDGELIAIDMETGSAQVLNAEVRIDQPPVAAGDSVYLVDGREIVVVNDRSGSERFRVELDGTPTTPVSVVGDLMVVGIGNRLVAIEPPA